MNRGIIVLSLVLMVFVVVLPGQGQSETVEPRVWIPEYCGFKIGIVEFSMWVENEIPLTSMTFDVFYDETIYPGPGICIDERAHGCFMNWASIVGGVRISMVCDSIEAGSGPLVFFRFDEPEELECDDLVEFTVSAITLGDIEDHSYQHENLTAVLPVRYQGDVNEDCEVNVLDVLSIYWCIISLSCHPTACQFWSMNVNNDERYNILDILAILDIVLGYGYPEKGKIESVGD